MFELTQLTILGRGVSDADLTHLRKLVGLKVLHIESSEITDAGVKSLAGLTKLTKLILSRHAKVTEAGITDLKEAIPNLDIERW